jgi:hypothetical protein
MEPEPGQSKLEAFKDRIKTRVVRNTFTTPEDLAYKVAASLGRFLITSKVKAELEDIPRSNDVSTEHGRNQVARRAARLQPIIRGGRVLLVNDFPAEMERYREAGLHKSVGERADLGGLGVDFQHSDFRSFNVLLHRSAGN